MGHFCLQFGHFTSHSTSSTVPMGKKNASTIRAMQASRHAESTLTYTKQIQSVSDDNLFQIDTEGSDTKKKRRTITNADDPDDAVMTSTSRDRRINKQLRTHTPATLAAMSSAATAKLPVSFNQAHKTKTLNRSKDANPEMDLWGEKEDGTASFTPEALKRPKYVSRGGSVPGLTKQEVLDPSINKRTAGERYARDTRVLRYKDRNKRKVKVDVAHQGQSYNPEFSAHQEMLGAAVAVEFRRKEVVADDKIPINNQGMSEEVKQYIDTNDDDSESSEEEGEEGGEARYSVNPVIKRTKKLTKADRNRQRRASEAAEVRKKAKAEKQFMSQILDTKKHKKEVAKEARGKEEKRGERKRLLDEKEIIPTGVGLEERDAQRDPKRTRSLAVALTSEIAGGLRTVVKKGDLLRDRQLSLSSRGNLALKNTRERKIKEGKKRRQLMKKQEKFIF